ncbi:MAG TPA: glycoside hydrolase family 97 protein [Acidobacteriaceae bacterium]|jgi:alpha-glucosidase|nr:glycoside hydrolase family 97 protein [Acidobacteriaceae bacterium]
MLSRTFCTVLFSLAASACLLAQSAPGSFTLTSPDHRLQVQFATVYGGKPNTESGALVYSMTYDDKPLVEDSALRLKFAGQLPLGGDVHLAKATSGTGVDDYAVLAGKTSHVHDAYNSAMITLTEPNASARTMMVEARAYNGAIAFRYVIPQQTGLSDFRLEREHTEFHISKDASTWALELPNFRSMYESEYIHLPISAFSNQGGVDSRFLIGLPLLMHVPGVAWMAITEADLEGNGAMYLTNSSDGWGGRSFVSELAPRFDDPRLAVVSTLPHHSAWRVFLVGDEPGRLIESNVIDDLNPPVAIADTSWIHPGKASWDWWSGDIGADGKPAFTTETMKYYVDFAAQSGFPYMLVDAGWSLDNDITKLRGNVDVPAVVQYAASKGVKIWIWMSYEPTAAQMDTAFPLFEKWGVAGVKIDFISRDDQQGIAFYYRAAHEAAAHHLMVDFHGATKPWGLDRMYPNVLGYEAVLGMEQSKAGTRDNPLHRTTIPFTRMLTGPMDYTPGGFDNVTEDEFIPRSVHPMVMGTRAQQLALYVIYRAPIQMVSDTPANYAHQPAFQFIRDVPVTWDETRVLNGFPGESVTIARRSGQDWYLGSITNWTARDVNLPLNFLGNGRYTAEIYKDAADADQNPKHVLIEKKTVQGTDTLRVHLASGGGCAIRFVRKK